MTQFLIAIWAWMGTAQAALVFKPSHWDASNGRILVVIHGCLQSAESMAMGTAWNAVAEKKGWAVLYPQVAEGAHKLDCWSWFLPENQRPESGELARIHSQIMALKGELGAPNAPVLLTGISSGAAIISNLLACYPNDFAAAGLHSGVSYGLAINESDAQKILSEGPGAVKQQPNLACQPSRFSGALMVIQGAGDLVVNPKNALKILTDFLPAAKPQIPISGEKNGRAYVTTDFQEGKKVKGRLVEVIALGHAWSGANLTIKHPELLGPVGTFPTQLPFFADAGPSATELFSHFFDEALGSGRADSLH